MVKRKSPELEDCTRINQILHTHHRGQIRDRGSYNVQFMKYLGANNIDFANLCFPDYAKSYVIPTAQAQLKKENRVVRTAISIYELDTLARVKNKVVFAKKTSVIVRGKRQVRYRDSKGRFASVRI